ncbi:ABC-type molybdate transport system permease subunit [Hymenobacter sp. UYCo722]
MLYLFRFLVKIACIALVLAFIFSISIAWLFAHPEVTTKSTKSHFHYSQPTAK